MKKLIIITLFLNFACASKQLAPQEMRAKTYTYKSQYNQDKSFQAVQDWYQTKFDQDDLYIVYKNKNKGKLTLKGRLYCKFIKLNGENFENHLKLTFETISENNKVNIKVKDITARSFGFAYDSGYMPSNKNEADYYFDKCVQPVVAQLTDWL